MSRAFVRESDTYAEPLPERPISPHANFVTRRGLAAIEARVRELEAQRAGWREGEDVAQRAGIERDLRYWSSRRASASGASSGLISWMAPLAQALLGREAGESVTFQGEEAEITSIGP